MMPVHSHHYEQVCQRCGARISTCRCLTPKVKYPFGLCPKCKEKAVVEKEKEREFELRLSRMENAMRDESPADAGYGEARAAVFEYVKRHEALRELILIFHEPGEWTAEKQHRWNELTGSRAATAKVLCDVAREAREGR